MNGDRPPVLTRPLARNGSWHADCEVCEQLVARSAHHLRARRTGRRADRHGRPSAVQARPARRRLVEVLAPVVVEAPPPPMAEHARPPASRPSTHAARPSPGGASPSTASPRGATTATSRASGGRRCSQHRRQRSITSSRLTRRRACSLPRSTQSSGPSAVAHLRSPRSDGSAPGDAGTDPGPNHLMASRKATAVRAVQRHRVENRRASVVEIADLEASTDRALARSRGSSPPGSACARDTAGTTSTPQGSKTEPAKPKRQRMAPEGMKRAQARKLHGARGPIARISPSIIARSAGRRSAPRDHTRLVSNL
jgi:hypothetical protein